MRPYILASVMDCDCSEQQAQRIECYNCNPLSCICEEGDSVICLFCEREYLFIQSDHDIQSIISEEDCPSLSSGAGANSVIQSPQQYDDLSKTFSHNLPTTNGGADDLTCFEVADDPGEGTSGLSGNVSRPCSKSDGYTKGRGGTSPDHVEYLFSTIEDGCDFSHGGIENQTSKDLDSGKRGKDSGLLSGQRSSTPVSTGCPSRSVSSSSTLSSSSDGSSNCSSRSSGHSVQSRMVHANDGYETSEQSKVSKNKRAAGSRGGSGTTKKIKPVSGNTEHKEGKAKQTQYWTYYKCAPADDSDGRGPVLGRPGVSPDPQRLRGASRNPRFILSDHTGDEYPHCHLLLSCSAGGGARGLRRCLAFLKATPVQIAEATANLQRVILIEKCVAYMAKYGPDTIFFYGKDWDVLKQMIHESDGVAGPCHAFEKLRNAQKSTIINSNLSKRNMMDDVRDQILSTQSAPYNAKAFIDRLTYDQKLQFMTMYGQVSWKQWIISVADAMNADHKRDQPQKMFQHWFDIHTAAGGFTPNDPEVNKWWSNLFEANRINPIEFLQKFFIVGDKIEHKKNAFILQGPTNCGKSLLFGLLTDGMSITPMTRDNGKNSFWLQSCLEDDFILYEEPMIAPENVNTWKLLLEGAPVKAQVKNQADAIMGRKPFFITTNDHIGTWINQTDRDALATRSYTFHVFQQISNPPSVVGQIPEPPVNFEGRHLFAYFVHILGLERMQTARERGHL